MTKFIDLTNKKFGKLTVNKFLYTDKDKHSYWECICECGNKKNIIGYSLRNGVTKSCGCLQKIAGKANKKNLLRQKIYRLTIIREVGRTRWGDVKWLCKCDCGKEIITYTSHLKSGHTKSCGCLAKETTIKIFRINLTGKKYGKITVINYSHTKNKQAFWNCKCDCGNQIIVNSGCLISGNTKSCGCETSRGNTKIVEILTLLNIKFEKEKRFPNCKNIRCLPFDFYLPDYNILIEFQGKQHYKPANWSKTKEKNRKNFEQTQLHDQIKRDYCQKNNIRLLEINYKDFDNIKNIIESSIITPF